MCLSQTQTENKMEYVIDVEECSAHKKRKIYNMEESIEITRDILCNDAQTSKEDNADCFRWIQGMRIEHCRICMFLSSQALLLSTLRSSYSGSYFIRGIPDILDNVLWCVALGTLIILTLGYIIKAFVSLDHVKLEYHCRVSKNYFFAPLISAMLLVLSVPPSILHAHNTKIMARSVGVVIVGVMMAMEMKIYGEWFMGGKQLLCNVANPSTHLSIVGNFVGSMLLASKAEWKEGAIFLLAIGSVHYLVLFVTLYQRLPTNVALPKHLNPVFFLFLAGPTTASLACQAVCGEFSIGCKMPYFLSLFLFMSLVVRMDLRMKFTTVWWAYGFPVTMEAVASLHYSDAIDSTIANTMSITLSLISMVTMMSLIVATLIYYVSFSFISNLQSSKVCTEMDPNPKTKKRRVLQRRELNIFHSNCTIEGVLVK